MKLYQVLLVDYSFKMSLSYSFLCLPTTGPRHSSLPHWFLCLWSPFSKIFCISLPANTICDLSKLFISSGQPLISHRSNSWHTVSC